MTTTTTASTTLHDPMGSFRACTKCEETYPETAAFFSPRADCRNGLVATCRECGRASMRTYYQQNREKVIARVLRYERGNRERRREYRRAYLPAYYQGNPDKDQRRRETDRINKATIGKPDYAICDGKTGPLNKKHGFALVRILNPVATSGPHSAHFRTVRLDQRLSPGERVVCHYQFSVAANKWLCLESPLGAKTEADQKLFLRLVKRERGAADGRSVTAVEARRGKG